MCFRMEDYVSIGGPIIRSKSRQQTDRDLRAISQRMKTHEREIMKLKKILKLMMNGNVSKTKLLNFITPVIEENNMRVDRLMRRHKNAIYCWICENIKLFKDLQNIICVEWPCETLGKMNHTFVSEEDDDII